MKRFLKEAGGIDQYPDVAIQWIFHHEPELLVFDAAGTQIRKIDLASYNYQELHDLFKKTFRHKSDVPQVELASIANRTRAAQAVPRGRSARSRSFFGRRLSGRGRGAAPRL